MELEGFEIPLRDIDSRISDPKLRLYGRTSEELKSLIRGVRVFVFNDIDWSVPFHCPSGVNVIFGGTHSLPAWTTYLGEVRQPRVAVFDFNRGDSALGIYTRD